MAKIFLASLCFCVLAAIAPFQAAAEDINYPQNGELRLDPEPPAAMALYPDSPSDNTISVEGSEIKGGVYGGVDYTSAQDAESSGNTATVKGSEVGSLIGGQAVVETGNGNASAENNAINLINSKIVMKDAIGGHAEISGTGSVSASGNTVNIFGSRLDDGSVIGGEAEDNGYGMGVAAADNNAVNITDSHVQFSTTGGLVFTMGAASASENRISVTRSTLSIGEYWDSSIGQNGSYVIPNLFGGSAVGFMGNAEASGNVITVTDSFINANLVGGMAVSPYGDSFARNNVVTLIGNTDIAYYLAGGRTQMGAPTDLFTGNTLNVWEPKDGGITVGGDLSNFQYYNFIIPGSAEDGSKLLVVGGDAWLNGSQGGQSGTGSEITGVNIAGGGRAQREGETFVLIEAATLDSTDFAAPAIISGQKGASLFYDFGVAVDSANNRLTATVLNEPMLNPRMKAVPESLSAGLATASLGTDLAAENGPKGARNQEFIIGSYTFGGMNYGNSRYNTGSHVDSESFSLLAGIARDRAVASGSLTFGVFAEAGWGEYDTYNSFATASDVHGSGNTNYFGGGLSFRFDHGGGEKGHFYSDAALRFGQVKNEFQSGDLRNLSGVSASYDYTSNYYGAHLGLGYIRNLRNDAKLDLYTRLMWTRMVGDGVVMSTGDLIDFDDADSLRWRTGLRYSAPRGNALRFYIGAAYEHEFKGDANARVYGIPITSPSLGGGTGIGEIGFTYQKAPNDPFSLDLGVSGYTGQREGFGVKLDLNWKF
ncbi:MAG: autotransporter outer membrane beta-barrel domain-containing protein [Synergistaceae bacterium]|nr:autotransporter outer membrane beta-barrel domain-containing protein [Synergistaceae bacterium]